MAEPQTAPPAGEGRSKGDASPQSSAAQAEPRSFGQGAPQGARQSVEPKESRPPDLVARGAQAAAETGRSAGRQAMTAWRQAFDPFLALQYDVNQWFDDMFRHAFGFRGAPSLQPLRPMGHFGPASLFGMPPVDLKETESAHVLAIELPGLNRDDVDVALEGDTLVISGHKAEESDNGSATYRVSERRFGRFERAFPLPADIDAAHISAQFRDGVLKITLPKNPAAAPPKSRIEIQG